MSTQTLERSPAPPPAPPGAGRRPAVVIRSALARWGLRGTALLYLGLVVALPTVAVITRGFEDGLQSLRDALNAPGAREAIVLTLVLAAVTAIINIVFGTLIAYVLVRYRFPGRAWLSSNPAFAHGVLRRQPDRGFVDAVGKTNRADRETRERLRKQGFCPAIERLRVQNDVAGADEGKDRGRDS